MRGSHGPFTDVAGLNKTFLLESEGGVLKQYGAVEYVNGVAPGVFAIIATDSRELKDEMAYMRKMCIRDRPDSALTNCLRNVSRRKLTVAEEWPLGF